MGQLMATFEFRLPDIGEGIAEGEVVAWHVTPGQQVVEDQEMVEVMTDKATVTIGCPRRGRIAQLNASIGERVKVGSVLVVIELEERAEAREMRPSRMPPPASEADTARSRFQAPAARGQLRGAPQRALRTVRSGDEAKPASAGATASAGVSASAVGDIRDDLPGSTFFAGRHKSANAELALSGAQPLHAGKPLATPATRKLARDLGVDLRQVAPTGPNGRVTKDDVRGSVPASLRSPARGRASTSGQQRSALPREERKPFVGLRRRIAERMQLAKLESRPLHVRGGGRGRRPDRRDRAAASRLPTGRDVKLHYLPFIVKAATLALKKHPILNSMLDEAKSELVYRHYYDIGVATATEQRPGGTGGARRRSKERSADRARDSAALGGGARSAS